MRNLLIFLIAIILSLNSSAQTKKDVKYVSVPLPILDTVVIDLADLDYLRVKTVKQDSIIKTQDHRDSLSTVSILSYEKKVKSYQADSVSHTKEIEIKDREIQEIKSNKLKTLLLVLPGAGVIGYLIGKIDD